MAFYLLFYNNIEYVLGNNNNNLMNFTFSIKNKIHRYYFLLEITYFRSKDFNIYTFCLATME